MSRGSQLHDAILWKKRLSIKPYQPDREHNRQLSRYTDITRHCIVLWCSDSSFLVAMAIIQIVYRDNLQRILHSRSRQPTRTTEDTIAQLSFRTFDAAHLKHRADRVIATVSSDGFWLLMSATQAYLTRDGCDRELHSRVGCPFSSRCISE